jgi:hypothetical protein
MADHSPAPDPPARRWRATARPEEGFQRVAVKSSARNRKAILLTAVILALGGAIAAWVFYPRGMPEAAFITIPVREYDKLPFNAFTVQDSELLLKHFPENLRSKEYDKQERERLLSTLSGLQARQDKTLVVHLRAHALRDDKGVYILPSDADPGVPATWIPLQTVLEDLRKCPAAHKLLLLDLMRPCADARLGILANDVAAGIKEVLDKEDTSSLLILCACVPGQVSLVSEDLQLSVFGYYLDQGLSGQADGYNARGARDERVSARELAEYVTAHVDRWARTNRGTRQTPVLYGKADDFPLVGYDAEKLPSPAEVPASGSLPEWLMQLWKKRDDWVSQGLHRRVPGVFQQLETLLLRAETRWRSGMEENRVKQDVDERLPLITRLVDDDARKTIQPEAHSLALARGRDKPADPSLVEDLRVLLMTVAPNSTTKAEDVDKALKGFQEKVTKPQAPPASKDPSAAKKDAPPAAPIPPPPYVEVAAAVFEAAVKDTELTTKKVRLLAKVLDAWKDQPRYVEIEYLQRLVRLANKVDDIPWPWRADVANQLLLTVRAGEQVAADPPALPWIQDALQEADKKRRAGEKILFTERYTAWGQAKTLLAEAEKAYATINAQIDVLTRARLMRDDALAFLPGNVPYLERLPARDLEAENWRDALHAAVDLYQALASPQAAVLDSLDDQRLRTRGTFDKVQGAYAYRLKHFLAQDRDKQATAEDYADFERLLASPRLEAAQRAAVWASGRRLARELLIDTRKADEAERGGAPLTVAPGTAGDGGLDYPEIGDPVRRAQLSIELLSLGALNEVPKLQQAVNHAKSSGQIYDANGRSLAGRLYNAWTKEIPTELQADGTTFSNLDRLSRISGLLGQTQQTSALFDRRRAIPQTEIRSQEVERYQHWLGQRFQAESQAAGSATPFGIFCAEAAKDYQR